MAVVAEPRGPHEPYRMGEDPETLGEPGSILGVDCDSQFTNAEQIMPPGSRLWIYSDGAFEILSPSKKQLSIEGWFNS